MRKHQHDSQFQHFRATTCRQHCIYQSARANQAVISCFSGRPCSGNAVTRTKRNINRKRQRHINRKRQRHINWKRLNVKPLTRNRCIRSLTVGGTPCRPPGDPVLEVMTSLEQPACERSVSRRPCGVLPTQKWMSLQDQQVLHHLQRTRDVKRREAEMQGCLAFTFWRGLTVSIFSSAVHFTGIIAASSYLRRLRLR